MKILNFILATILTTIIFPKLYAQDCSSATTCGQANINISYIENAQAYEYTFTVTIPEACNMQQAVSHVSFGLPQDAFASNIGDNVFFSPTTGIEYEVENTTNNPFYCIKFNVAEGYEGIKKGDSDTFTFQVHESYGMITEFPVEIKIANNSFTMHLSASETCMPEPTPQIALPVELLSFRGKAYNGGNELSWITASEKNNNGFIITHSTDGKSFNNVGWIDGAGSSSTTRNYTFTDRNFSEGINYYRLAQLDYDSTITYSQIISIENKTAILDDVQVFPTSVMDAFTVKINMDKATAPHFFKLVNLNGEVLKEWTMDIDTETRKMVEVSTLSSGTYFLNVRSGNDSQNIPIVKVR